MVKIEPAQVAAWRKRWIIAVECGPDRMDTPERDRVFHWERSKKTGKPLSPQLPVKNATYNRSFRGGLYLSPAQKRFRSKLRALITARKLETCAMPMRLCVWQTYGGKKREVAGRDYPSMDSSACLEAVCDAIQSDKGFAGLVLDDGQIVDRRSLGIYSKGVWGIRFELEAMPGWGTSGL